MMQRLVFLLSLVVLLASCTASVSDDPSGSKPPVAVIETNKGIIEIELNPDVAPITVTNFLQYVNSSHYDGTVFHRVIKGFMIQGGGFTPDGSKKSVRDPIKSEAGNGLKNEIGTIAMARTSDPDSATSQFFINVADNSFLDARPRKSRLYDFRQGNQRNGGSKGNRIRSNCHPQFPRRLAN